ncbi:CDP-alcohol phosphatidyltransferase family protein [Roseomonas sp. PWR1]|uniref:CDP-diacylglycerol--glycerol-3-phosphate 3-phosphatidyltransferase n=1 Tax=Roseomonas nitratireducens TaxID=2820810 RepID=A0ABS4AUV3_9PROT|nr:CDP-alcohol phosphatidyltransferase family protein [Neoroseomonas nitratireducens]
MPGGWVLPDAPDRVRRPAAPASADVEAGLFTVPNLITLARLCAVPAAVWLMLQHRLDLAFLVFVAAGVSDAVDGWLARVWNARSALGALLDPVADKALLVSVYVTLAAIGVLPDWLAILVVFRDLLIVGGVIFLWVLGVPARIRPILVSKANTAAQIALAALALLLKGFGLAAPGLLAFMIGLVAFTTLASGAAYVLQAARLTGDHPP